MKVKLSSNPLRIMRDSKDRNDLINGCRQLTAKVFPTELGVIKQIDKIFYEVIKKTADIKPQTWNQKANYALAIRSYREIHCAMDLLENGYYEVANTVLRSLYENYVQMAYFVIHEDDARRWLTEDATMDQGKMRDRLGFKPDFYTMLSRNYAHPLKATSLKPLIFDVDHEGKISLNHYPVFSDSECYDCLIILIFLSDKVITQMQRVFKAEQVSDKVWMRKIVEIQKVISQYIESQKP